MRRTPRGKPTPGVVVKHVLAVLFLLIAAGCSGSSCGGGCSSCTSFTPLPSGFDPTHRIENSGAARITPSGLTFLQNNLGTLAGGLLGTGSTAGLIQFNIPKITGSFSEGVTINYTVCPNGSTSTSNPEICVADIDIGHANLKLASSSPSDLTVTGTLPIRLQDLPVSVDLGVCTPTINVSLDGDGSCPGGSSYAQIPLNVDIAIQVDTNMAHTARYGYSAVTIKQIVDTATVTSALESDINICGQPSCDALCCIENACTCALAGIADWSVVKDAIIKQVVSELQTTLNSELSNELCQTATATAPCPTGTTPDSSMICRYADNSCASIILGTDGHANLGTLLQSLSPGTSGAMDLLFAAGGPDMNTNTPALHWGDLDPVAGGVTIGLFGGADANPVSKCVPLATATLPTGIPIPDELLGSGDSPSNWPANYPGPDVEIAVSERFANYALSSIYSSGLLCVGVSTESVPLLSSSTIGLLAPSSKTLTLQEEPQQVAITIRPSTPPTVTFGNGTDLMTDPNLRIDLKQVSLDFYVFSLDRFIRFMTATFDLDIPANLTVSPQGITPVIQTINVANGTLSNNELLSEDPTTLASSLGQLIASVVGQQVGGSLSAINYNSSLSSLGMQLFIPDTVTGMGSPGLVKLTKGTDNYLGIFAAFGLAGATPPVAPKQHTNLELVRKTIDPEGLRFETLTASNMPVIELAADAGLESNRPIEYQYKIDDGFWHPFQASRILTIKDPWMRVQGRHVVYARSRYVGVPNSVDEVPAQTQVVIDATPPRVTVRETAEGDGHALRIDVRDRVTADPMVRYRLDDKAWSAWTPASKLGPIVPGEAASIAVESSDNDGNIGTAQQALVRGRFDGPTAACGCKTAGGDGTPSGGRLALVAVAIAGFLARRKRRAPMGNPEGAFPEPLRASSLSRSGAPSTFGAVAKGVGAVAAIAVASSIGGCSCGKAQQKATSGSAASSSGGPSCPSCIELQPGLIGEYTSVAVTSTGDIWVAGYSEADYKNSQSYGDLVVGKWDGTKVDWEQADGVPTTPAVDCTQYDCSGFRGGQTTPGDDVGLWTSIAIGPDGNPAVAYYDRTNLALKFAQYDGKSWNVQAVDSITQGDTGRYAKLLVLNGNFVIAYQQIAPGGMNGALISKVRVATSTGGTPTTGTWTFEDAVTVNTTPCRASYCASTEACVSTTKLCTATIDASMCSPACASGDACFAGTTPTCLPIWDTTKIDAYPDAIGDYISVSPDGKGGFGLSYYDRTNGNLMIASKASGTWATLLVDGESAKSGTGGDSGIGSSLFIDASGDWHLTYSNGYTEALQYVKVAGGTTVGTPEIVDTGLSVGSVANTDGQHVVGDDSHILVLASGEVHVTYQDATAGTLHYAIGMPGPTSHTWTVSAITQSGFAGAFSNIVVANNQTQLMNWWRTGASMVAGDVRIVPPQ